MNPTQNRSPRVLVIDDEPGFRELLSYELGRQGYQVTTAENGEDALQKIKNDQFDLAISDVKMPKVSGIEFLEAVKKQDSNMEVIIATGFGTIETAVSAMKKGAYDFIQKPYNLPEVLALVEKALEKSELKAIIGVYEASKAIFKSIKLDSLLPIIIQLAIKIIRADDASIMLLDKDNKLELVATSGLTDDKRKQSRLSIGERVAGKVALWKEPLMISGSLEKDERFKGLASLREIRSSIVYPLQIDGNILGVINVNRTADDHPFNATDMFNITIFGSQIAQAVYNAKLYRQLETKILELKNAYDKLENTHLQLLQSEKLAAIGQLAAGVAHELNNPLTGILGFSQLVLECKDLPAEVREDIQSIHEQSKRCRDIVQHLLQFSRRREPVKESLGLESVFDSTLQLIGHDLTSSGIDVRKEFPAAVPQIYGDPFELEQVFLNIMTNAKQAMKGKKGGVLSIRISEQGDRIVASIEDNGCGISSKNIGKIFDPFFTTKQVGEGTGLGLSISYGIIEQHHGKIRVESREGDGTTFFIELPVYRPETHE